MFVVNSYWRWALTPASSRRCHNMCNSSDAAVTWHFKQIRTNRRKPRKPWQWCRWVWKNWINHNEYEAARRVEASTRVRKYLKMLFKTDQLINNDITTDTELHYSQWASKWLLNISKNIFFHFNMTSSERDRFVFGISKTLTYLSITTSTKINITKKQKDRKKTWNSSHLS